MSKNWHRSIFYLSIRLSISSFVLELNNTTMSELKTNQCSMNSLIILFNNRIIDGISLYHLFSKLVFNLNLLVFIYYFNWTFIGTSLPHSLIA